MAEGGRGAPYRTGGAGVGHPRPTQIGHYRQSRYQRAHLVTVILVPSETAVRMSNSSTSRRAPPRPSPRPPPLGSPAARAGARRGIRGPSSAKPPRPPPRRPLLTISTVA